MAEVTGPISTLPGTSHSVPAGTMCDDHPTQPATHRVQGETDSFGCEMADLCDECFKEFKEHGVYTPEECDWCKKEATDIRPTRDYEEGLSGPVYYVCGPCRKRRDDRVREEMAAYDNETADWDDDWDDDDFAAQLALESDAIEADEFIAPRRTPVPMTCKACGQPYQARHRCTARRSAQPQRDKPCLGEQ